MGYKDFKKQQIITNKERVFPVLSDLIGETKNDGDINDFIKSTQVHLESKVAEPIITNDAKAKNVIVGLLGNYKEQVNKKNGWLTKMGLIERKIMQYRYFRNTQVAFSTQSQKSGDNIFTYILLRSPFVDSFKGKKEIRLYFNKLEDYPNISSIEELANNKKFYNQAITEIRKEMERIMSLDGINYESLFKELDSIDEIEKQHKSINLAYEEKIRDLEVAIMLLKKENNQLKQNKK